MNEPPESAEPWTVPALRGSVVRFAVLGPIAALAGYQASFPQALFSCGLCAVVVGTVTFGERWLTRNGPVGAGPAIAGGVAAWGVITAALVLFQAEVRLGFGELAWDQGPAVANEALLVQLGDTDLGWVILLGASVSPLLLTVASHVSSESALEAVGPSTASSFGLSIAAGVFTYGVATLELASGDALGVAVGAWCMAWVYLSLGSWAGLLAVACSEFLEQWAFGSRSVLKG